MKNMKKENIKLSRLIGRVLAWVQHFIDLIISWAFGILKKKSGQPENGDNKVVRVGKRIGGFIGEAGTEYYKVYEKLKNKKYY